MSIESLLSKLNIDDAVKGKTLVERVKLGLKLIDDIANLTRHFETFIRLQNSLLANILISKSHEGIKIIKLSCE